MKSIVKLFAVALLLISYAASAQSYVFKVLANKGSNSYKSSGAEWSPLKTGQSLNEGDELKLSEEAYLGLMHSSGKTLEVKTEGMHKVSTLASSLKSKNSSVASKYADFVINKMSDDGSASDYRKSLGATGAVDRALSSGAMIKIMAHSSSDIINDQVVIRWNVPEQEGEKEEITFQLVFSNLFDDVIKKEETSKTAYMLDMSAEPFVSLDNKFVKVKVIVKGNDLSSDEYAITTKPDDESVEIKKTLSQLRGEVEESTALDNIVLAAFYEEHDLLLDALTAYEKAIAIAPDVDIYERAYADFLIRNNFSK
ncbi:MAG: hypothetical protein ACI9XJ_000719 [Marivirga sp.]|jgi:hypothetical protein